MIQYSKQLNETLSTQILDFCKYIAGDCQITSACLCGDCALGFLNEKVPLELLLVIRDFQPRLLNYFKVFNERNTLIFAVDEWVFERDVDRGFLGEALAGGLIFPYIPLVNEDYLRDQEVKLKKRLILELLENLVLNFPELSYEIHIEPEYFMYETMLTRARLFPPTMYNLLNFLREDVRKENIKHALRGYSEALRELKEEKKVSFANGYVKITEKFAEDIRSQRVRFTSLFKTAQRALFTSLAGIFPKTLSLLSQNRELFLKLQRIETKSKTVHEIEDPQRFLHVSTASGLIPLTNRISIEAFVKRVLCIHKDAKIETEEIGGILNDVYLIKAPTDGEKRRIIVKKFKDWSSFKWFPLTLWTVGTRTFAVLGRSRLEKECAINQLLYSKGFSVPKILYVSHIERLVFMEFVEGENLDRVIKRIANSKIPGKVKKELTLLSKVGETFAHVHTLGIALGDTKPENIIVRKNGEIFLLDFEQASRNGDKVWDIAEFLYYAGHAVSPFVGTRSTELMTKTFIQGYLKAGGNAETIREAGNPKYTKVFSVFTFPHIMFAISNICRKTGKQKE